ncbi:MAG: hypothetical protein HND47_10345 [Chloroflexi bacterium]|nr:hypothetical protein [Chloroflexota bacterium]
MHDSGKHKQKTAFGVPSQGHRRVNTKWFSGGANPILNPKGARMNNPSAPSPPPWKITHSWYAGILFLNRQVAKNAKKR